MSIFSKRNLLVGIATFVIGIGACAAIWGVPKFLKRSNIAKAQNRSMDEIRAVLLDAIVHARPPYPPPPPPPPDPEVSP